MMGLSWITDISSDISHGYRLYRRNPLFFVSAVLSLTLGIGANATVFSVVKALMLEPLPVADPESLFSVRRLSPQEVSRDFPYQIFQAMEAADPSIEVSAYFPLPLRLVDESGVERINGVLASGNHLEMLGVVPVQGRLLTKTDDNLLGGEPVAVISHRFWEQRYRRDSTIVGRNVSLNRVTVRIVGVVQAGFEGVEVGRPVDFWLPVSLEPKVSGLQSMLSNPGIWWLELIGRLRPGETEGAARDKLTSLFQASRREVMGSALDEQTEREIEQETIVLLSAARGTSNARAELADPLALVAACSGLVLLIACSNVATLLLGQAAARRREVSVRSALGAGRVRLIRQILAECSLLGVAGTVGGLAAAFWAQRLARQVLASQSVFLDLHVDGTILAAALGLCLVSILFSGGFPAWSASGGDPGLALRSNSPTDSLRGIGLRRILTVSQVAFSVVLLLVSGLLIRSLTNLESENLGYSVDNILLAGVDTAQADLGGAKHKAFARSALERVAGLPGVESVSYALIPPLSSVTWKRGGFRADGNTETEAGVAVELQAVGPDYFKTLGIQFLQGRTFTAADQSGGTDVAVVNQRLAQLLGLTDPLGHRVAAPPFGPGDTFQIVGVTKDVKPHGPREQSPAVLYLPYYAVKSEYWGPMTLVTRYSGDAASLKESVGHRIRGGDNQVIVGEAKTIRERLSETLEKEYLATRLISIFGLLAIALASIGLAGLVNYSQKRRTRELAIRMALGARRRQIILSGLREVAMMVAAGAIIGVVVAQWPIQLLSSLLFGVQPNDPATLAGATLVVASACFLAGYLPCRKAARTDPASVLRFE